MRTFNWEAPMFINIVGNLAIALICTTSRLLLFMFVIPKADVFVSSGWVQLLLNENGPKMATLAFIASFPVGFCSFDTDATAAKIGPRKCG